MVRDPPLSLGAASWSLFEGARIPYVLLITIYIFMPYLAGTVVGDPVRGQEMVSRWSQYSGWAVMLTAPFLGASIDKLGPRKIWLGLIVAIMVPMTAVLWFTKADHSGLSATAALAIAAVVGILYTWSEVLHNSLLVRAAGLGGAHKASGLGLALGNALGVVSLAFTALGLRASRPAGDLGLELAAPRAACSGLQRALHEPERVVALLAAGIFAIGALPFFLFTPDAPRTGIPAGRALRDGAHELWRMIRTVRENRDAAIFLASRMFYVDGMTAILIYTGIYAAGVMKWQALQLLAYGVILSVPGGARRVRRSLAGPWRGSEDGDPDRDRHVASGDHRGARHGAGSHSLLLALDAGAACAAVERPHLPNPARVDLPWHRLFERRLHHGPLCVEPHPADTTDAARAHRGLFRRLRPVRGRRRAGSDPCWSTRAPTCSRPSKAASPW